jgi:hypothetical protein
MEGGEVPGIDNAQLRHQSQAYFEKLKASFARRDYKQRAPDELFRASFRVISPE